MKLKIHPWTRALLLPALALGLSSCASSTGTLSKKDRIDRLLDIAGAAIADNDAITALETLNQVQSMDDSVPREHHLYALAYLSKNETAMAEQSARRALKLDPVFSAAQNTLGKILLDQGRLNEAESVLKSAANNILFREAYLAKTSLGILYYRKMDFKNSELWLQRAIAENGPVTCLAYYHLGRTQLEQKNIDKALRSFNLASKGSCGGLTEAHIAVGKTLLRQKKYDQARAKFIEIQRLFPGSETSEQATEIIRGIP